MDIRYGIIGCGNIAKFHFNALRKINANITWIADINAAAAGKYAIEFGAKVTSDYNDLISADDVDIVCVLASSVIHKDVLLKSIAANKHIICEKTMTNNEKDSLEVLQASRTSDKLFFTAYMKRFFSASKKLESLLPDIGKIYTAYARSYQAWGNFYSPDHGWDLNSIIRNYGGAVTKCAGSHMLDTIICLIMEQQVMGRRR